MKKLTITTRWLAMLVLVTACDQNVRPLTGEGAPPLPPMMRGTTATQRPSDIVPQGGGGVISGTITLAPELSDKLTGREIMFIMARRGGGAPLAVKRVARLSFPMSYTLSAADQMAAGPSFIGQMEVVARIDRDGSAGPLQTGDMEGNVPSATVGQTDVHIVIDRMY
ncbi:MAG: hypothetical protein VYA69_14790 [Gemmatimonadota bacterium]|nr:hypothetical protein [Gemmatimonadota bacterium]